MILTIVLLLVISTFSVEGGIISTTFTTQQAGEGTYYGPANGGGACGYGTTFPDFVGRSKVQLVAINSKHYVGDNQSEGCGLCVSMYGGTGSGANPISKTPFIAFVTDKCPGCAAGDIDLNKAGDGRWKISWKSVACPIASTDKFFYKFEGSNNWYIKVQVVNAKLPIKAVAITLNNKDYPLTRSADNFWLLSPIPIPLPSPPNNFSLKVKVTSSAGETVTDTITIVGGNIETNNGKRIQGTAQFSGTTGAIADEITEENGMSSQGVIYIGVAIGCAVLVVLILVVIVVYRRKYSTTEEIV